MTKWSVSFLVAVCSVFFVTPVWAQDSSAAAFISQKAAGTSSAFELALTPQEEARVLAIGGQLRCMVCGGQSIIDSQNENALVMRKELQEQVRQGKSDAEISAYMVQHYGEDVLTEPPLSMRTVLLWLLPPLFILLAAAGWLHFSRRKQATNSLPSEDDEIWAREALAGHWTLRYRQWVQVREDEACSK